MKRFAFWTWLIAGFFVFPSMASAMIITYDYTATDGTGTVTGTFGYDTNVPDSNPGDPSSGLYNLSGFFTGSVSGGVQDGGVFNLTNQNWTVSNNIGGVDTLTILGPSVVNLRDTTGTVFNNDSLPLDLNLADFTSGLISLLGTDIGLPFSNARYNLTSITNQQQGGGTVTEPGTVALFVIGLAGLGVMRRRWR